jgi:hypothetical protein
MKKWLTSIFLLLALASGVLAGMPLHSGNMNSRMMDCCKKAKSKEQSSEASIARLCCALNCTDPAPTSSSLSYNFSPSTIIISDSIVKQIAQLLYATEKPITVTFVLPKREILPRKNPPKYIRHHSFLI